MSAGLGITDAAASTYLGLLDLIVDDGQVTDNEVDALTLFSKACGIDRAIARQLNLAYLDSLSDLAESDGIVSDEQRAHSAGLMGLLGRALPH